MNQRASGCFKKITPGELTSPTQGQGESFRHATVLACIIEQDSLQSAFTSRLTPQHPGILVNCAEAQAMGRAHLSSVEIHHERSHKWLAGIGALPLFCLQNSLKQFWPALIYLQS